MTAFRYLAAGVAALACALPAAAADSGSSEPGGWSLELRGTVPVVCQVSLNEPAAASPSRFEGTFEESCNSPYRVFLVHSPGLSGASVYVDGVRTTLSSSGSTLVSTSASSAIRTRSLVLDLGASGGAANLSLRIVPT